MRVSRVVLVTLTFLCPVIAQNVRVDMAKHSTPIPKVCQSAVPASLEGTIDVPALVKEALCKGAGDMMDFTDPEHPTEIAYFDRGPIDPKMLVLGGDWSAYWYNGHVYASEIARGLDILDLTPTKFLTQNEIDAAKTVRVAELNVQNQEQIEWPRQLIVAKAYVDQLERSQALASDQISALRQAISSAEASKMKQKDLAKLKDLAPSLEKTAATATSAADATRLKALAEILKSPVR